VATAFRKKGYKEEEEEKRMAIMGRSIGTTRK
jgi:hypothetical protein